MVMLQYAFVVLLIGVLAVAVGSFVVMGLGKLRRTRRLARAAHEHGMRFFPDDPYDVARRYADFAAISGGHSPRAHNVTDGRLSGRPVRAFDFRCELGHGTRRTTRRYGVVAADAQNESSDLLMWHDGDAELAPLAALDSGGHVACWSYRGPAALASRVARAAAGLAGACASIEVRGSMVMIAAAGKQAGADYGVPLTDVKAVLDALRGGQAAGEGEEPE